MWHPSLALDDDVRRSGVRRVETDRLPWVCTRARGCACPRGGACRAVCGVVLAGGQLSVRLTVRERASSVRVDGRVDGQRGRIGPRRSTFQRYSSSVTFAGAGPGVGSRSTHPRDASDAGAERQPVGGGAPMAPRRFFTTRRRVRRAPRLCAFLRIPRRSGGVR